MIIIDGHNLIGTSHDLKLSDLQAKDKLIERLTCFQKILDVKIIVVFDGKDPANVGRLIKDNIEIIYPDTNETADEVISGLCRQYAHAKDTVIVSSDKEVIDCSRKNHLITKTSQIFTKEIDEAISRDQDNDTYLSPVDLDDWLGYFNKN